MPRVHQILASLVYGDAIGNQVMGIRAALVAAGFESSIYVENADARLEDHTSDYRDMLDEVAPDDLLIHHFSLGSRASRLAYALDCRMMLVYHNITPPEYFLGVHPQLVRQCYHGRRELVPYRSRVDLAVGASEFNRRELDALGFSPTGVLRVVPEFSHIEQIPDPRILESFDDDMANVLFVGRMIPNKRPDQIIRHFHAYQTAVNADSRLLLAGSSAQFENYRAALYRLIAELGLRNVHLLGHVTNEELTALYDVADLFLCASEHEGFCVPLIESFYKRVPVLAYASTAVPDTLDGGGVLFTDTDPSAVAAHMTSILENEEREGTILAAQDQALERLLARDFTRELLGFVKQVLDAPRRPPVDVAPDFWREYQLANELEALRAVRPSALHALPIESATNVADVGYRG